MPLGVDEFKSRPGLHGGPRILGDGPRNRPGPGLDPSRDKLGAALGDFRGQIGESPAKSREESDRGPVRDEDWRCGDVAGCGVFSALDRFTTVAVRFEQELNHRANFASSAIAKTQLRGSPGATPIKLHHATVGQDKTDALPPEG
jgi:hypothetical protein